MIDPDKVYDNELVNPLWDSFFVPQDYDHRPEAFAMMQHLDVIKKVKVNLSTAIGRMNSDIVTSNRIHRETAVMTQSEIDSALAIAEAMKIAEYAIRGWVDKIVSQLDQKDLRNNQNSIPVKPAIQAKRTS
jgi:hypothetical protein